MKFKPYLRSIVRNGGKGRMGFGVELFRLDSVAEEDLTAEELEVAEESKQEVSSTAIMRIYEEIGEDFWTGAGVSAKRFSDDLNAFGEIKRLNVHINSLGGDVFTAQAIYSILCDHNSKKTAYIDGVAASAATVIACGADEVVARLNTNYMIHHPWAMAVGNAETMRKAANDLEAVTVPIISVYKEQVKDKISEEQIRELMDDETWLTADEALGYGFVDKVRGKIKAIAKVGKSQILCSGRLLDVGKYHYRNVPDFPIANAKMKASAESKPEQKESKKMTKEEVDPQIIAEIEANAKSAERTRLRALDEMNGPGLGEIIAKAKEEGKHPQEIALECLNITKAQLSTTMATSALAKDARLASAVRAGDAPLVKPESANKSRVTNILVDAFKAQAPKSRFNGN